MDIGDLRQKAKATAAAAEAAQLNLDVATKRMKKKETLISTRQAIRVVQKMDDINRCIFQGTAPTRKEASLALAVKNLPKLYELDGRPDVSAPSFRKSLPLKEYYVDMTKAKKAKRKNETTTTSGSSSSTTTTTEDTEENAVCKKSRHSEEGCICGQSQQD